MARSDARLTLAVLSPKGGCGRSTVALNLAFLLAAASRPVALVDLAQFGSLAPMLRLHQTPGRGIGPAAACLRSAHRSELKQVLQEALHPVSLGGASLAVLTAAAPQRQDDLTAEELLELLNSLAALGLDLILDTSQELSDRLAAAMHAASHQLLVLTPDPAAGYHALQAQEIARQLCAPPVPTGLLLNRYHRGCGIAPADLAAALHTPLWAVLPDSPGRLPLAAHAGVPLLARRWAAWRRPLLSLLERLGVEQGAMRLPPWHQGGGERHGPL